MLPGFTNLDVNFSDLNMSQKIAERKAITTG